MRKVAVEVVAGDIDLGIDARCDVADEDAGSDCGLAGLYPAVSDPESTDRGDDLNADRLSIAYVAVLYLQLEGEFHVDVDIVAVDLPPRNMSILGRFSIDGLKGHAPGPSFPGYGAALNVAVGDAGRDRLSIKIESAVVIV